MKNNKRLLIALLAGTLICSGATGCGPGENTETAENFEANEVSYKTETKSSDPEEVAVSYTPDEEEEEAVTYIPDPSEDEDQQPVAYVPEKEETEPVPTRRVVTTGYRNNSIAGSYSSGSGSTANSGSGNNSTEQKNTSSVSTKENEKNTSSDSGSSSEEEKNIASDTTIEKEASHSSDSDKNNEKEDSSSDSDKNTEKEDSSKSDKNKEKNNSSKSDKNKDTNKKEEDTTSSASTDDENEVKEWQAAYIEYLQNLSNEFKGYILFDLDDDKIPEMMTIRIEHSCAEVISWNEDELVTSEAGEYSTALDGKEGFTIDTENHLLYTKTVSPLIKIDQAPVIYILKDGKLELASDQEEIDEEYAVHYYFADLEELDDSITDVIMKWEPEKSADTDANKNIE